MKDRLMMELRNAFTSWRTSVGGVIALIVLLEFDFLAPLYEAFPDTTPQEMAGIVLAATLLLVRDGVVSSEKTAGADSYGVPVVNPRGPTENRRPGMKKAKVQK